MECAKSVKLDFVESFLKENGRTLSDIDDQLTTNKAFIYRLTSGEVVLVPGTMNRDHNCLIFRNRVCFDQAVTLDHFPAENYDQTIEEIDVDGLKNIALKIPDYMRYLTETYSLTDMTLVRANVVNIYGKILANKSRNPYDLIALGAVMGEVYRRELLGRWVLRKWYGTYNPYYSPLIVFDEDRIAYVYDVMYAMIESQIQDGNKFFIRPGYASKKVLVEAGVTIYEL